jgi:hypothetical protein
MSIKQQVIDSLNSERRAGWGTAKTLAKARAELSAADFKEVCEQANIAHITACSYARVGGDAALDWAVNNNIITGKIGTLTLLTGIPIRVMQAAAKRGELRNVKQSSAAATRARILESAGLPSISRAPRAVRSVHSS